MQTGIALILADVTKSLISYLEAVLPTISDAWWQNGVINSLSFQQKRRVEQSMDWKFCGQSVESLLPFYLMRK